MSIYFEIMVAFVILGAYVFGLFRWWHRQLTTLADRYDVPGRRRRAAILFPVVLLFFAAPVLIVLLFSIRVIPTNVYWVVIALLCSLAPGVIWWICKMPSLLALGYGRQR